MLQHEEQITGIYLRISDDREGRELGVTRQREDCIELAKRLGFKVFDIYNDNDRGASRYSRKPRKNYIRLLADARAGRINNIIAYTTGRLTRRPREHEDQIDLAQDLGIQFHYVRSPSFDLNTSAGRRIARILASNDAGEADDISERVSDAKRKQASKGLYLGGYRAYGYEGAKHNDKGELINRGRINVALVPHEVEIIREGVRRICAGETPWVIMKDLNRRGVPSPAGKLWLATNFKRQLIKKRYVIFDATGHPGDCPCLENPDDNGTLVHRGTEHRAIWPGIISGAEYELMMARLGQGNQPWDHGMIRGRTYLCTGFIFCGKCGGLVYGQRRKRKSGAYRRYNCRYQDNSGNISGCGSVHRMADPLEYYVTEEVLTRLDRPEVARALACDGTDLDIGPLATKLASLEQRKADLAAEYGRDELAKDEYKVMAAANADAIRVTQGELAELQSRQVAAKLPALNMIRSAWEAASIEWRRSVIRLLVERIDILPYPGGKRSRWQGWLFDPDLIRIVWKDVTMTEVAASLSAYMAAARRANS